MAVRQLDAKYQEILDALTVILKGGSDAVIEGDFSKDIQANFKIEKWNFDAIRKGFSRQEIEDTYQKAFDSWNLSFEDLTLLVTQSDIISGIEKAYRLRHKSRLTQLVSGVSRARGQSGDHGYIKGALAVVPLLSEAKDA